MILMAMNSLIYLVKRMTIYGKEVKMDKISKEFLELSENITDVELQALVDEPDEPTITVSDWFGKDKEVTREEYVDLWVRNADLYKLVHYKQLAYMEAWVQDIKDEIAEIAGLSWDLAYNVQEEDKK